MQIISHQIDQASPSSSSEEIVYAHRLNTKPLDSFEEFERSAIDRTISTRFEEQVDKYPDRIALVDSGSAISYRELDKKTNRVATSIVEAGGNSNAPVALLLEQGAHAVTAILGVLKAGRPYVSLDPSFPPARNNFILKHSGASTLVSNQRYLDSLDLELDDIRLVNIDQLDTRKYLEPATFGLSPDSPACIIYTSGSTGRPKGVIRTHRNILHDIRQYTNFLHISPEDRMTLLYSCSVGGSLRDIFGALLNGAALYPFNIRKEGLTHLGELLRNEGITFYHSVPSVFRNFVSTLRVGYRFPELRLIRLGGERVLVSDVNLYRQHFSNQCILYTGMGATETGHIRCLFINKRMQFEGTIVPTGYEVEDKEVLILGKDGELLEPGVIGEIAVKSCYLSPGYWNDQDATTTAFISAPGGGLERIFKTGDLGRMSSQGCLEHLGRRDFQLKVRGYRVEAAEIEGTLLEFPGIQEVIVINLQDKEGNTRLVAYYAVQMGTKPPSVSAMRYFVGERLPEYMVPSIFEQLDKFPLTPNGKVDRRALPLPKGTRSNHDVVVTELQTAVEKRLVEIWQELLDVDGIGVNDNFLELGAHSLNVIQAVSRIRAEFHVDLPLRYVFEHPNIAELAEIVENA